MRHPACPLCEAWQTDLDTRPCDVTHMSRVEAELTLQRLQHITAEFLAVARPHGRWRTAIPKEARVNPRTLRAHQRTILLMHEALYDALSDTA